MADLSLVTDNFFATASETFTDNLSGSIAAGAATVPVNSAVEYATGEVVVLTVEPGTANEATFIGEKDTTNQFINCIWTEGNTAVGHDAGATIIDYDSATHFNALSKGVQQFANQDGSLKYDAVADALGLGAGAVNGWEVLPYTVQVSSGYNKGQKEFDVTIPNADATSVLSVGMKLRMQRGTAAPTQCADFESTSSQYASRATGSLAGTITSFTDDWTNEAWICPENYTNAFESIISRRTATAGWAFGMDSNGRLDTYAFNTSGSNIRRYTTYCSIPLGKWVHVAMSCDLSGSTFVAYINGVSVQGFVGNTGSAVNSITQTGDLYIGSNSSSEFFDGKVADVRVWNAIRTATQIRDNMNQQLAGSETNLIGYWKLSGNFNDSTSSANNLTGSGGAVATTTDHPFKDTEYAKIVKIAYSAPNTTVTVFTGHKNNIPNMTLSAPYYSSQGAPYGFPTEKDNWRIESHYIAVTSTTLAALNNTYETPAEIYAPTGNFEVGFQGTTQFNAGSGGTLDCFVGMGKDADNIPLPELTGRLQSAVSVTYLDDDMTRRVGQTNSAQTSYKMSFRPLGGSGAMAGILLGSSTPATTPNSFVLFAECAVN